MSTHDHSAPRDAEPAPPRSARAVAISDAAFYTAMAVIGATYVLLIVALLAADAAFMVRRTVEAAAESPHPWATALAANPILTALGDRKIQYSIWLTMISCTLSAVLSVFVAVPLGYLMARHRFFGRQVVDAILDIPIVLPPLVVGLSLLILFQFPPFRWFARSIVYQVPAVILAQFSVACAFSVRTMKATFEHIDPRCEQVALSLGCTALAGFRLGRAAGGGPGHDDGPDAGLGPVAGRVRPAAGVCRRHADEDRGPVDVGIPGDERGRPGSRRGRVVDHGPGGRGRADHRPPVGLARHGPLEEGVRNRFLPWLNR